VRRAFGRTKAGLGLAHAVSLVPRWWMAGPRWRHRKRHQFRFLKRIAHSFARPIELVGTPSAEPGTLFVCNHISWLDIPVLGAALQTEFVAKDDIRGWPGIGALARRTDTLFVSRTAKGSVGEQISQIADRLSGGGKLLLFAEGTTSDGVGVLPFRSSLFAAAHAARRIQPVVISYHARDGAPLDAGALRKVAWIGDDELVPSVATVARMRVSVRVTKRASARREEGASRQALAARCQQAITDAYAALRTENRSA